ncbi:MAG: hypothetical protein QF682_09225 [Candidatus Thermoplasmatota archaeon]|jgi:hypothetical protein|nr:hypothetical protein [Candidatus Thermoplasmatota archaeon]
MSRELVNSLHPRKPRGFLRMSRFALVTILDDPDGSSGMTGLDESINSSDLPRRYLASRYRSCFAESQRVGTDSAEFDTKKEVTG